MALGKLLSFSELRSGNESNNSYLTPSLSLCLCLSLSFSPSFPSSLLPSLQPISLYLAISIYLFIYLCVCQVSGIILNTGDTQRASMSGTPQTEVKWQENCYDRTGVSSRAWSILTIKSEEVLLVFDNIAVRNPGKSDTCPVYHFFSLPLSHTVFSSQGTGTKQESKLYLLAARVRILNKSRFEE